MTRITLLAVAFLLSTVNCGLSTAGAQDLITSFDGDCAGASECASFHEDNPVSSAIAPDLSIGPDVCAASIGVGVQAMGFGLSGGGPVFDEHCEALRAAKLLTDMGQGLAALYVMCQAADGRYVGALGAGGFDCAPVLRQAQEEEQQAAATRQVAATTTTRRGNNK